MKIKMLTLNAGPKGVFPPGTVIGLEDSEARALIDGGFAELVIEAASEESVPDKAEPIEVATVEAPEKAVSRVGRTTRRRK